MLELLRNVWGTLVAFPIVAFLIIVFLVYFWKKDKKVAFNWSVNITNIFLIFSVVNIYKQIWPQAWSAWIWVISSFLFLFGILLFIQRKMRGKISLKKIGFSTWRISFIILTVTYCFLITTGIVKTMQAAHVGLSIM